MDRPASKNSGVRTYRRLRGYTVVQWATRGVAALLLMHPVALPAFAQSGIDRDLAREYFAEATDVASRTDTLWRIRTLGPLLFIDPETRQVVANAADIDGLLTAADGVYIGVLPDDVPIANTATVVGGRRYAMIMWPLPSDRATRLRLLFHESFHRVQPALGFTGRNLDNSHLNTLPGRIWTRLEWRALAEALLLDGARRVSALQDAMAFRTMRIAGAPSARTDEQALLLNEGLAEYSGWRLSGEGDSLLPRRVAIAMLARERQESLARSFAYASGPAYGVLLDQSHTPWRSSLSDTSDLTQLLISHYKIRRVDTTHILDRSERYGGTVVRAEETELDERRAEAERVFRSRFVDMPVLALPTTDKLRYSFNPNDAFPLAGLGTVYGSSQITDVWGTLRVTRNGVLLKRVNGAIARVIVPAGAGVTPPMSGPGWTLTLSPGWTMRSGSRTGDWLVEQR